MRYRAQLVDAEATEKPIQVFSESMPSIEQWAKEVFSGMNFEKYPKARIEVYETTTELVKTISGK